MKKGLTNCLVNPTSTYEKHALGWAHNNVQLMCQKRHTMYL